MEEILRPLHEEQIADIIKEANANDIPLNIIGNGSKKSVGRPSTAAQSISMDRLRSITLFQPNEMVISALAGTPVSFIEHRLSHENMELAFEPLDLGPALGQIAGQSTIGSVFATNISGPKRIRNGAARDHLIGIRGINGRGESFKSGGRVMKNVTGYDLVRGLCGSWGTLAIMTEVTMKVVPKAEESRTLFIEGLDDDLAINALCAAMATPFEVSGTTHLQKEFVSRLHNPEFNQLNNAITAIRIESFPSSVSYRAKRLKKELSPFGNIYELDDTRSRAFWDEMRNLSYLEGHDDPVWRISVAPRDGAKLISILSHDMDCRAAYDWSGGLIWLEVDQSSDASASDIRRVIARLGGHATLIRATEETRASINVFHPLEHTQNIITRAIKKQFDPKGILNPGRMYAGV